MIKIKKTGEAYYLVSLTEKINDLSKNICDSIKKEIEVVIKPHREITIDLKGVKTIDNRGVNIFQELKTNATAIKCKLKFINIDSSIAQKISKIQPILHEKVNQK